MLMGASRLSRTRLIERYPVPEFRDDRGALCVLECGGSLPFQAKRFFVIYDVPHNTCRAQHAVSCDQLLLPLHGSVELFAVSGAITETHFLQSTLAAALIPANTWIELRDFSEGAILLVASSEVYSKTRYFARPS